MAKDTTPVDGYYGNDDLDLDKSEVNLDFLDEE